VVALGHMYRIWVHGAWRYGVRKSLIEP